MCSLNEMQSENVQVTQTSARVVTNSRFHFAHKVLENRDWFRNVATKL